MAKLPGKGTLLQWKTGTPTPTFQTVAQRLSLDGPKPELKMRTTTDLDSQFEEKRPAYPDLGTMGGVLYFNPNDVNQAALRAKIYAPSQTPDLFQLVYADGDTTHAMDAFSGFLTKWDVGGIELDGTVQATFEIALTDAFASTTGTP